MKNTLFDLHLANQGYSYRSYNYKKLPQTFTRPLITCFDSGGVAYLDAGAGYSNYQWNTGQNTRLIQLSVPGAYDVFVPRSAGSIRSHKFYAASTNDFCNVSSIRAETGTPKPGIFPNPAADVLKIDNIRPSQISGIRVFDILGNRKPVQINYQEGHVECVIS